MDEQFLSAVLAGIVGGMLVLWGQQTS